MEAAAQAAPSVTIRDVGPRDGLQSLAVHLPTDAKVDLVERLASAGIPRLEVGAFVSPKAVPAMADSPEVFATLTRRIGTTYEALVPNLHGAERAIAAGADAVVVVVAASDTFSLRNVGMSREQSVEVATAVARRCRDAGVPCVADVATAFGCAYEGSVAPAVVADVAEALAAGGLHEIVLADTAGVAAPSDIEPFVDLVRQRVGPTTTLGLHFHDTRGLGVANVWAGWKAGVTLFDASVGGLGGCPFSPGATGNVCTEEVVHMFDCADVETGIDLDELLTAARELQGHLAMGLPSHVLAAGPRWAGVAP